MKKFNAHFAILASFWNAFISNFIDMVKNLPRPASTTLEPPGLWSGESPNPAGGGGTTADNFLGTSSTGFSVK